MIVRVLAVLLLVLGMPYPVPTVARAAMGGAAIGREHAAVIDTILTRRWMLAQFRATSLTPAERDRLPVFLGRLGQLPGADRQLILNPMVDLFALADPADYRTIADDRWREIDAVFDAAHDAGIHRFLPTLTFKIDPSKPGLRGFCAETRSHRQGGSAAPHRETGAATTLAIANGSCLPQYASPAYRAAFAALLAQAIGHFERRYGDEVIGYEPAGGVAGEIDWKGTDATGKPVFGDNSAIMQTRFRAYLLQGRPANAATVAWLNACLGTRFARLSDVAIPEAGDGPHGQVPGQVPGQVFAGALGKHYAAFRVRVMADFYRDVRDVVKQAAPGKLFSLRMGSLIDATSGLRGTLFFQQLAEAVQPDLMISDASTFNHYYEGPIVAPTLYAGDPSAPIGRKRLRLAWGSVADKFSTYARKNRDFRAVIDRQTDASFTTNGFSVLGFFLNPGEMAAAPQNWTYLASVARRLDVPPSDRAALTARPVRTVRIGLGWALDDLGSVRQGQGLLRRIRSETKDFRVPVAIRFVDDIGSPSASGAGSGCTVQRRDS